MLAAHQILLAFKDVQTAYNLVLARQHRHVLCHHRLRLLPHQLRRIHLAYLKMALLVAIQTL